jgi:mitochondrial fission protein ELM1
MRQLIIWRFSDGKPGHDAQSQGLIDALRRLRPLHCHDMVHARIAAVLNGQFAAAAGAPKPDLLIGAGRRTHVPLLAARLRYGGRTIVLMKPDLPHWLFDLCIIPQHDGIRAGRRVLTTLGALNTVEHSSVQDPAQGLILIGGPSTHHDWSDATTLEQLQTICTSTPGYRWTLSTSRRTPESFLPALQSLDLPRLQIVPFAATTPGWLPRQLRTAAQVWVSEDSVSMIFEALTAGAAVGLLRVPALRQSRIIHGVDRLISAHWVTPFAHWRRGEDVPKPGQTLAEAQRCARWIEQHWLIDTDSLHDLPAAGTDDP